MVEWRRNIHTVLLSIICLVVSVGAPLLYDSVKSFNKKLDSLLITVTVHNSEAEIWKSQIVDNSKKIEALENGQHEATQDRFTRDEAMKAIDDLKEWVDRYYARK